MLYCVLIDLILLRKDLFFHDHLLIRFLFNRDNCQPSLKNLYFEFSKHQKMKRLIPIIFLLLVCATAQGQVLYGLKAGPTITSISSESRLGSNLKIGWHFGAMAKKYVGDIGYFIQGDVLYSIEGNSNYELQYVKIPMTLGFDFSDNFNMHIGYQPSFMTSGADNFKDFNSVIHFGMEFYTLEQWYITMRFNYGLTDIVQDTTDLLFRTGHSITIELSVCFIINKTKSEK